jgi:WD40 repeat protein
MGERHYPSTYITPLDPGHTSAGIQVHLSEPHRAIWTSSACPTSEDFVLGTSCAAMLVQPTHCTTFRIKSDVFATCFLPDSTTPTFLAGSRDGDIRLFDIRSSPVARPDIVLRHGGTVTHIRALSREGVVVNGLQRVANYDLRYPHPRSPSSRFASATKAVRVYEKATREKEFMIGRGFDVDRERGVMAIADHEQWVNLFSVQTGEKLESPLGRKRWEVPCTGLWFEGDRLWASERRELRCFKY